MKLLFLSLVLISCAFKNKQPPIYKAHLASEGDFVMLGNPSFAGYVENKLTKKKLSELETTLRYALEIPLTQRGFVQAATRDLQDKKDDTNYDAVWVRDSAWVYFSFIERNEKQKARVLLLALWDYYSSKDQQSRFREVIANPKLSLDGGMHVPHIRFNGNSSQFEDVLKDGRPEEWNHRQNDAHGLFLLAMSTAVKEQLISSSDFNLDRRASLNLFAPYFEAIEYWNYPDAGAWEEISKINTSSVSMVVKAFENWDEIKNKSEFVDWKKNLTDKLIKNGYERVRKNLSLGGESPDHDQNSPEYRREDAALFNLFLPMPLKKLTTSEKKLALTILEKLIRPYGVIRYPLDSYQSGNYWVKQKRSSEPDLTGDSSNSDSFRLRFSRFIPNSEAQWFFDSKLSMIYLQFAEQDKKYLRLSTLHFKRALGQITPASGVVLGADKKPVQNLSFPESINTVTKKSQRYYLPSPITPLNWAKASFSMALGRLRPHLD